jgi:glycosyltransferase involved in cell wall biosynthesis
MFMKKILIFSLTYIPLTGGAEVAVKEITDRMGDNYEWDMITLRPNKSTPRFERVGNINIYRVGFFSNQSVDLVHEDFFFKINKLLFPFTACIKALILNRKKKYNAIWSIMAAYAGLAGLFLKVLKPKIQFILTLQEGDTSDHVKRRAGIFTYFLRKIFKKVDYIQAISNYLIDFAKDFDNRKEVIVIPNGVDPNKFKKIEVKKDDDKFRIITTSRLVEKNGIKDLILSLNYLDGDFILDILGTGPLHDELVKLMRDNSLESRVSFRGNQPQGEMIKYMQEADVFVRPSLSEGLGNSFLEAVALGLPIIGTKVGGIPDFLKDGETGLFCQVNNPEDVARKIRMVKGDPILREKLIRNGQSLVKTVYSWETVVSKFEKEIFDKIG